MCMEKQELNRCIYAHRKKAVRSAQSIEGLTDILEEEARVKICQKAIQ